MPDYVIVLPVDPLAIGAGFAREHWPLHLTIVGNFSTAAAVAEIAEVMAEVARTTATLTLDVGDEALFRGPPLPITLKVSPEVHPDRPSQPGATAANQSASDQAAEERQFDGTPDVVRYGEVRVSLIHPNPALNRLHRELVARLQSDCSMVPETPQFFGLGYRPHVTHTATARAVSGQQLIFGQLALMDMKPHGDEHLRRVVAVAELPSALMHL